MRSSRGVQSSGSRPAALTSGLLANVVPCFLFALGEKLTSSAYAGILNGTTLLWTALTTTAVTR